MTKLFQRHDHLFSVNINVENLVATVESFVEAFHPQVPVSLPGLVRRVPCTERSHSAAVNENKIYATNTEYSSSQSTQGFKLQSFKGDHFSYFLQATE
jgi:hypothetical protein